MRRQCPWRISQMAFIAAIRLSMSSLPGGFAILFQYTNSYLSIIDSMRRGIHIN
jgi:hypothetical protein